MDFADTRGIFGSEEVDAMLREWEDDGLRGDVMGISVDSIDSEVEFPHVNVGLG